MLIAVDISRQRTTTKPN